MAYIQIHEHRALLGGNEGNHRLIRERIKPMLASLIEGTDIEDVDMYNMLGKRRDFDAGGRNRIIVFANATANTQEDDMIELEESLEMFGIDSGVKSLLPPSKVAGRLLIREGGYDIAEYDHKYNQLYILFDIFPDYKEHYINIFENIIRVFNETVFEEIKNKTSWVKTSSRDELIESVNRTFKRSKQREIERLRENISSHEYNVKNYQTELKRYYDKLFNDRRNLDTLQENLNSLDTKFVSQLDNIANHPKVEDIKIVNDRFHVYTKDIIAAHDKRDEFYYIGKFRIEIKLDNSEIYFINLNNKRHGYWGAETNAPHVDEEGLACYGNVSVTIAELCSQLELYALVLVLIDFLENVNTEDSAGKYITRWDVCNEDGTPIYHADVDEPTEDDREEEEEEEDDEPDIYAYCEACGGEIQSQDDAYTLYETYNEDSCEAEGNELEVCRDCASEHYFIDDNIAVRELVRNMIDEGPFEATEVDGDE